MFMITPALRLKQHLDDIDYIAFGKHDFVITEH